MAQRGRRICLQLYLVTRLLIQETRCGFSPWRLGRSPAENPLTVIFLVSGQASFGVPKVKQLSSGRGNPDGEHM